MENWIYKNLVRPALFQMDVEEAHNLGHRLLPASRGLLEVAANRLLQGLDAELGLLATTVAGRALPHPIGLAAGFDKNVRLLDELAALGFSLAEIGSVTALPGRGNVRPRLFRLPLDGAVINRLGLNGEGADAVALRLAGRIGASQIPLALNIAPTNIACALPCTTPVPSTMEEDIAYTFARFKNLPLHYVTINTSCPNTHDGVLKESSQLRNILLRIGGQNSQNLPVFLKLSPDANDAFLKQALEIAGEFNVRGFVLGNTSTTRNGLRTDPALIAAIGAGGLSGTPIRALALNLIRRVARLKRAEQEIIACGGLSEAQDILAAIKAGAQAVQIYTAMVYEGPFHAIRLRRDLALLLARSGKSLAELVGSEL
ncbi:MAG: quinone-dependent dihydroorotate dehydrogenase [Cyanobacteria bacterium REEB67]|nr:quinone-dependent dihydroorotate dehydrogenase [Cyanobacteria bacterium REEB67]